MNPRLIFMLLVAFLVGLAVVNKPSWDDGDVNSPELWRCRFNPTATRVTFDSRRGAHWHEFSGNGHDCCVRVNGVTKCEHYVDVK